MTKSGYVTLILQQASVNRESVMSKASSICMLIESKMAHVE